MWGMLHTVSRADFIRSTIKTLEKYMNVGYEQSGNHGPQARQFIVLFDMAGFNVKQYTWRPGKCYNCVEIKIYTFFVNHRHIVTMKIYVCFCFLCLALCTQPLKL